MPLQSRDNVPLIRYVLTQQIRRYVDLCFRPPVQTMSQPLKKRKLGVNGPSGSQGKQNSSFTEVLEQYDVEAKKSGGKTQIQEDRLWH